VQVWISDIKVSIMFVNAMAAYQAFFYIHEIVADVV